VRISGRLYGFAALAVLFALASGGAGGRPLHLNGPQRQTKSMVALVTVGESQMRLSRVDEDLFPMKPQTRNLGFVDAWAFSPGGLVALATHPYDNGYVKDSIRFANLGSVRLVRGSVPLGGVATTLMWRNPSRIVALVYDCCSDSASIVVVNPATRRIVSRQSLDDHVATVARGPESLVLLLTPQNEIGPSRLAVIDPAGKMRTVPLKVVAGMKWPQDSASPPLGTQRIPAVTVDPESNRAYVIQPDGPAAEISLDALDVSYHDLTSGSLLTRLASWLEPAAEAKGLNGPSRHGLWLGDGIMAVTGSNDAAVLDKDKGEIMTSTPAGAIVVDTRDWTVRTLDRGADELTVGGSVLLTTGRTSTSTSERSTGMGLAAYGDDLLVRYRLFGGESAWVQATWAGRGYIQVGDATHVIDLASGRIVGERTAPVPRLLVSDGP
jgi:hypothetical protein